MKQTDKKVIIEGAMTLGAVWLLRNSSMGVAKGFVAGKVLAHFINQSLTKSE